MSNKRIQNFFNVSPLPLLLELTFFPLLLPLLPFLRNSKKANKYEIIILNYFSPTFRAGAVWNNIIVIIYYFFGTIKIKKVI
jgi:hypothetical protein